MERQALQNIVRIKREERFLEALRAALHGETVSWEEEIPAAEWRQLFRIAQIHKVLPMIFEAVFESPAARRLDPSILAPFRHQTVEQVWCQSVKTEEFLELAGRLKEEGISPLVFKGLICRNLYPKPDHRLSGDEDILIPEERFLTCHEVMRSCGMKPLNPNRDIFHAHEVSYIKEEGFLHIEMHRTLFEPDSGVFGDFNRYFEGIFDRAVQVRIQGADVLVMDSTDFLFYLLCHAAKHFMHCGVGIRQVCDLMMYADAHEGEIDWMRISRQCRELRIDLFAAVLFRIGQNHLGFEKNRAVVPKEWRNIQVSEKEMLEDILDGGIYGSSTMSRKHSSNLTIHAVENQKTGKQGKNVLFQTLFPSAESMKDRYPYLKDKGWLLPVAWTERFFKYGKKILKDYNNGDSAAEAVKTGRERTELMRQYGILR